MPPQERHGKPADLWWMWLATNLNIFYIINGIGLRCPPSD